jgi:ABC-type taurine transport system ATPase subunit
MANAHDFIMGLPQVETYFPLIKRIFHLSRLIKPHRVINSVVVKNNEVCPINILHFQMRIFLKIIVAIARALVSNPKILLLDEATSALG